MLVVGMIGAAVLGGIIALVVVLVRNSQQQERVRKAVIWDWAVAHGWGFIEATRAPWTARLPGRNSRGLGVSLTGHIGGRWVTVSEYSYQTTSDNSTTTHYFIAVVAQLDQMYPPIDVQQRGLFSQFGRALFGDKPTATGNVLFDSQFRIDTADPVYAKRMVTPRLIEAHIARAVPFWSLVGTELLTYVSTSGKLRDPNSIPGYAAPLLRVAALLGR
jgi:hypothetical protein